MSKPNQVCSYCRKSECYGWHHWGCSVTGETVDENDTCADWDDDD